MTSKETTITCLLVIRYSALFVVLISSIFGIVLVLNDKMFYALIILGVNYFCILTIARYIKKLITKLRIEE